MLLLENKVHSAERRLCLANITHVYIHVRFEKHLLNTSVIISTIYSEPRGMLHQDYQLSRYMDHRYGTHYTEDERFSNLTFQR